MNYSIGRTERESVIAGLPKRARVIMMTGFILVALMMLDSITTAIGFSLGLGEANPVARLILEKSPMVFWFMGSINFVSLTILVTWLVRDHPKLYHLTLCFMIVLVVIKSRPVIWNIIQILIMEGIL